MLGNSPERSANRACGSYAQSKRNANRNESQRHIKRERSNGIVAQHPDKNHVRKTVGRLDGHSQHNGHGQLPDGLVRLGNKFVYPVAPFFARKSLPLLH